MKTAEGEEVKLRSFAGWLCQLAFNQPFDVPKSEVWLAYI